MKIECDNCSLKKECTPVLHVILDYAVASTFHDLDFNGVGSEHLTALSLTWKQM